MGERIKSSLLDGVSIIIGFVFYLLGVISGTILTIGGYLMDLGLALNRGVIDNEVVAKGFPITLNVANLFFILAMIIIAFATILRYEPYGAKKLLTKLIIAAVLINFSLTLAGLVVDFTGVFSNYFVQGATVGGKEVFSESLTATLDPQKILF